jgi:hypothetical protein
MGGKVVGTYLRCEYEESRRMNAELRGLPWLPLNEHDPQEVGVASQPSRSSTESQNLTASDGRASDDSGTEIVGGPIENQEDQHVIVSGNPSPTATEFDSVERHQGNAPNDWGFPRTVHEKEDDPRGMEKENLGRDHNTYPPDTSFLDHQSQDTDTTMEDAQLRMEVATPPNPLIPAVETPPRILTGIESAADVTNRVALGFSNYF